MEKGINDHNPGNDPPSGRIYLTKHLPVPDIG